MTPWQMKQVSVLLWHNANNAYGPMWGENGFRPFRFYELSVELKSTVGFLFFFFFFYIIIQLL